ncbi:MAG: hypothetical protein WA194_03305 [Patescibacteria group bacterium]
MEKRGEKGERERGSENEGKVEKEEMRAVYGRLRVYEIRHFGAPVG